MKESRDDDDDDDDDGGGGGDDERVLEKGKVAARLRPSASISALISATVTLVLTSPWTLAAWSSMRRAMSPVPPAMSRMCIPREEG